MNYYFDLEEAKELGVNEAIFISNLRFWIFTNKANEKHFHEDRTWSYNSVRALEVIFPFWTPQTIKTTIKSLIQKEVIITGFFSHDKFNRTAWYAFSDEESMLKTTNAFVKNNKSEGMRPGGPIPPLKPALQAICGNQQMGLLDLTNVYKETDIKHTDIKQKTKELSESKNRTSQTLKADFVPFEEFRKIYPRKEKMIKAEPIWNKLQPSGELFSTILAAIDAQTKKRGNQAARSSDGWSEDWPLATSWLNARRWEDEVYDPAIQAKNSEVDRIRVMQERLKANRERSLNGDARY